MGKSRPNYNPSKPFSIAARSAAKLRVVEETEDRRIPSDGIPPNGIPSQGIPSNGIPTAPVELPARGWVKAANWLFDDLPFRVTSCQWIIYMHLYRLSVGFNSQSCRIGYGGLARRTRLCRNTVINNISELRARGLLDVGDTNQDGTLFLLCMPAGIPSDGIPSDGIPQDSIPSVPRNGIPCDGIPSSAQLDEGVPSDGIPPDAPIKDKGTKHNTQTQVVLEYLQSEGLTMPETIVRTTVARYGYTVDELKLLLTEVRTWADNPTGAMIQAMNEGRQASAATRETAAAAEVARVKGEEAKRQWKAEKDAVEERKEWLAAKRKEEGKDKIEAMERQVIEEAEKTHDFAWCRATTDAAKKAYINSRVDALLLSQRDNPS